MFNTLSIPYLLVSQFLWPVCLVPENLQRFQKIYRPSSRLQQPSLFIWYKYSSEQAGGNELSPQVCVKTVCLSGKMYSLLAMDFLHCFFLCSPRLCVQYCFFLFAVIINWESENAGNHLNRGIDDFIIFRVIY